MLVCAFVLIVFSIMCSMIISRNRDKFNEIKISENTYMTNNSLFR